MIDERRKEELKSKLTTYVRMITQQDRAAGRNMYQCPLCGSGTHGKGSDGAFSITRDGKAWKCFSCNESGDVFTLIGKMEGLSDFSEQLAKAEQLIGNATPEISAKAVNKQAEPTISFSGRFNEYIRRCARAADKTDYFAQRGLTPQAVKRFNLGYDESRGAIVIPYDAQGSYYITRSTAGKTFRKPRGEEAGEEPIYNKAALRESKPCFVTESPMDAMSIMLAGDDQCNAIALGGTGYNKLIEQAEQQPLNCTLILSLDNDEIGEKTAEIITKKLAELDILFTRANYSLEAYSDGFKKDANDYFRDNPEQLKHDISAAVKEAYDLELAEKKRRLDEYYQNAALRHLKSFENSLGISTIACINTGFYELDLELDGGLFPGLYILGAVSSFGKTTFLLQIANQIARSGQDVLFFSLEMASEELIIKSLSSITCELAKAPNEAITARKITALNSSEFRESRERDILNRAIKNYSQYANHLFIYEGIGNLGTTQIREMVETHKKITGRTPLVFIDYLQVLAPYSYHASDKQNMDKSILELKRMSRDFKTPVVAASSFNRDSYVSEVNMASFKESGSIEYGSDVLLALQPYGMRQGARRSDQIINAGLIKKCRAADNRDVEIVILKNRNGRSGGRVLFKYHSAYNYFESNNDPTAPEEWESKVEY